MRKGSWRRVNTHPTSQQSALVLIIWCPAPQNIKQSLSCSASISLFVCLSLTYTETHMDINPRKLGEMLDVSITLTIVMVS